MLVIFSFFAPPLPPPPPPPPKAFAIFSFRLDRAPLTPPGLSSPSSWLPSPSLPSSAPPSSAPPLSSSPRACPSFADRFPRSTVRRFPPLSDTSVSRSVRPLTRWVAASAARCTSRPSSCCPASRRASVGSADPTPALPSRSSAIPALLSSPGRTATPAGSAHRCSATWCRRLLLLVALSRLALTITDRLVVGGRLGIDVPTGLLVTGPLVTGPLVTGPLVTGPLVTGPLVTGPLVTGPLVIGLLVVLVVF